MNSEKSFLNKNKNPNPRSSLPTSHSPLVTSNSSLVTSHSSLVTTHYTLVTPHFTLVILLLLILLSCTRTEDVSVSEEVPAFITWTGAYPMAILRTGRNPIWFQLTDDGPVHIRAIEDAAFSSAFVPWPHAPHIRFLTEYNDGIAMIVNRDGFLFIVSNEDTEPGLGLYRFSGGDFWKQYTAGGFVLYEDNPAGLLYLENRFLDSDIPLPQPGVWTFNMNSNEILPLDIPALQKFPADDGWNIETLRFGTDGMYYFRAAKRKAARQEIRNFRTADLDNDGVEISADVFFSSAPRQTVFSHPLLPVLPEGFVYTGIAQIDDSLFASWEEQDEYNIGAAGFVIIRR